MPRARARRSSTAARSPDRSWPASSLTSAGSPAAAVEQAELHAQRDELLLGAVVQVPLDPLPLVVLGLHQPAARRPQVVDGGLQLGGQPDVAQHEPGLGGQVGEQPVLRGGYRLVLGLGQRDGAEQLVLVIHADRPGDRPERGQAGGAGHHRGRGSRFGIGRPDRPG